MDADQFPFTLIWSTFSSLRSCTGIEWWMILEVRVYLDDKLAVLWLGEWQKFLVGSDFATCYFIYNIWLSIYLCFCHGYVEFWPGSPTKIYYQFFFQIVQTYGRRSYRLKLLVFWSQNWYFTLNFWFSPFCVVEGWKFSPFSDYWLHFLLRKDCFWAVPLESELDLHFMRPGE